jgi:hypothetical protein
VEGPAVNAICRSNPDSSHPAAARSLDSAYPGPTLLGYTGLTYAVAALFLNASFLYWTVRLILE